MEAHSKKQEIKKWILKFWDSMPVKFKSEDLITKIWMENKSQYLYPDTVLRYMRELKSDGLIDYVCENRKSRIYMKK